MFKFLLEGRYEFDERTHLSSRNRGLRRMTYHVEMYALAGKSSNHPQLFYNVV